MKILFLAHRVPYPPDKGEKIRAYHELRFLASQHQVDLFAFASPEEQAIARPALSVFCSRVHLEDLPKPAATFRAVMSLLTSEPFTNAYFHSNKMAKVVSAAIASEQYDLAFGYCSAVAPYLLEASSLPVMIDFVDSDASKWRQYAEYSSFPSSWLYRREATLLGEYERKIAQTARLCFATTPLEAQAIDPEKKWSVRVMENGVSLPASISDPLPNEIKTLGKYVLFLGQMDYLPNIDAVCYFVEEIFPKIHRSHPGVKFLIVGRNPSGRVRRLANHPGVVVTDAVPEVHPYLRGAIATVAPFRICQGIQNKILESLALGVPVVSTPRPALAVGGAGCKCLFVAESPEDFARTLIKIIDDPNLARSSCGEATRFIEQRFHWGRNLALLGDWLQEITKNSSGAK